MRALEKERVKQPKCEGKQNEWKKISTTRQGNEEEEKNKQRERRRLQQKKMQPHKNENK